MTTIMASSTLESVNDESSHLYVPKIHKTIINLNYFLTKSFNEYNYHLVENDLELKRHDKNKLGIHFIVKELIKVCSKNKTKKWFYYKTDGSSIEYTLVKRLFNALPTNITYSEEDFDTFLEERDYMSFNKKDTSTISFYKFRLFLRRYELQQIEEECLSNINIKLSLLP